MQPRCIPENEKSDKITERESRAFFILKAFAILFALTAHMTVLVKDMGIVLYASTNLWRTLSSVGVPIFLVSAGFFYHFEPKNGRSFWKKKFFGIALPWLIAAVLSCAYLFMAWKLNGNEPENIILYFLKFIFGFNSFFYYVPVLLLLFAVFSLVGVRKITLWVSVALTILSLMLEMLGLNYLSLGLGTAYLNIFNWIGYFAIGVLAKSGRWDRKLLTHKPLLLCAVLVTIGAGAIKFCFENDSYFDVTCFIFGCGMSLTLYAASYGLARTVAQKPLVWIGRATYCIYLYHMYILIPIMNKLPVWSETIQPFLSLAIMSGLVWVGVFLCKRIFKIQWPLMLVGLK